MVRWNEFPMNGGGQHRPVGMQISKVLSGNGVIGSVPTSGATQDACCR